MQKFQTFSAVILALSLTLFAGVAQGASTKWVVTADALDEASRVVESSACLVDLDGNGTPEVVIGSGGGTVYAIRNGSVIWSYYCGEAVVSSPAAGDLNNNGRPEVVVGCDDGMVYAISAGGGSVSGWPKTTGGAVRSSPIIVDLNDDGYNDVVVSSNDGFLYAWDGRGVALPGFPYDLGAASESSPTVGDIDDDGKLEVLVGDDNGFVHAINEDGTVLSGWPQKTDFSIKSSPALGDIDADGYLEIVVGSYDFNVYAWKPNGMLMPGWPVTTEYRIYRSSPAFADVDGDGGVEVLIGSGDGFVYAFKEDGRQVPGFPLAATTVDGGAPAAIQGSVTVADIDGDGGLDILAGSEEGVLFAWTTIGLFTPGFPYENTYGSPLRSTPAIGDLDGNGATDIVFGTNQYGEIHCIEMGPGSYYAAKQPWPMFLNNASHVTLFGHGEVPSISIEPIEGEQTGDITVLYEIEDRQGDLVDLEVVYTEDSGVTWHIASTTGQLDALGSDRYRGSIVWHSRDDLDHFEDTDIKIKLLPSDVTGMGQAIESTLIHLDNNDPPLAIIEPLDGEQTEDVFVDYRLEDSENDELSFIAEYSIDGGESWQAAWIEANTDYIDPPHYADQLWWDSMTDLPNQHIAECLFAITPSDRDANERQIVGPFVLDNNQPPQMYVENLTGEQVGALEMTYEVIDEEGDLVNLACFYSKDFGQTWHDATVEGELTGVVSSEMGSSGTLIWRADTDLPSLDESAIQFRIIPSDLDEGEEDDTVPFRVDNNMAPMARVFDITEEVAGEVTLAFAIDDAENDICDIVLEYSLDNGASWIPALTKESIEPVDKSLVRGFPATGETHYVTWLSEEDAGSYDTEAAMLRITAMDNDPSDELATTVAFHLDNNYEPMVLVDDIPEEVTGDIVIAYGLSDEENDLLSIVPEFSADGGASFQPATVSGQTEGIGSEGYNGSLVWNSTADFDGLDQQNLVFRLTVSDNDTGETTATSPFWVDNSVPPTVMLTAITEEVTSDITIAYQLDDREGDPLSFVPEFSDDGGVNWKPATTSGQTEGITSAFYNGIIIWNSVADTGGTDQDDIHFRLRPFDNDEGGEDSIGSFKVDNSFEPTVSIATVLTGEQTEDIIFNYNLSDAEGDTLSLTAEFSQDGGYYWEPATTSGQLTSLTPELYSGNVVWNSKSDLLGTDLETMVFRLVAADNDAGEPALAGPFHLDNNAIPTASLGEVSGEWEGDVPISFTLADDEADIAAILPEYSIDGGSTWREATVKGLTTASYYGEMIWESVADIDGIDSEQVVFRITPEDNDIGEPGLTNIFQVDNNHVPQINLADYDGEQVGNIEIVYNVNDRENDYADLTVEYSLDGISFKPATVDGNLSEVGPTPYEGTLYWDSLIDTGGVDSSSVVLRITPADNDTGEYGQTAAFQVDNSEEPSVVVTEITEEQSGDVTIAYALADVESDVLSIIPEFSDDGGATWQAATVLGETSGITPARYNGSLLWNSVTDMDGVDNFNTHFRLRPSDNDEGDSGAIGPFQVDNSAEPTITLVTPDGEQIGETVIAYTISDRENDAIDLVPEFSADGGSSWNPATTTGQLTAIAGGSYSGSLSWNSKLDLDNVDNFKVAFRLTPSDNDVGELGLTANFQVDNSDAPTVQVASISGEQTDYVTVEYTIFDREGDPVSLTPEWSSDGGTVWNAARITQMVDIGQPGGLTPDAYSGSLDWNSKADSDFVDLEEILFRLTPEDNDIGEATVTGPFRLDNSDEPTITVDTPPGEQSEDVLISYNIEDREGDPVTLTPEFSRNGGTTWETATVTGQTESIDSEGYYGSLVWNSKNDTDMHDLFEVIFRLTASDNDIGATALTKVFQVDNSDPPTITLSDIDTEQVDDITIGYQIADREDDPVSLLPEYSTDGGASWNPATTRGELEGISSTYYAGSLTWNSKTDVDQLDSTNIVFRLTPRDNDIGSSDDTAAFQVDNSDPPSVVLTDITEEQTVDVTIAYAISDREGDPVSILCEYSPDGGASWNPATVSGITESITSSGYKGTIIWNSKSDTDGVDLFNVRFRITPSDNDTGTLDETADFQVDNSDPPAASLGAVDAEVANDIVIPYNLTDREGDPLDILCEYSLDGGETWNTATVKNATSSLTGSGYSGEVVWDSVADLYGKDADDVVFRVTPSDNDVGSAGTVR